MSNKKWVWKEFILPFLIMLAITAAGIAVFMITIGFGKNIAPVQTVGDEMTKPTVGRICYEIVSFVGFVLCAIIAEKKSKAGKIDSAFYIGFLSGMLLWQSLGEASWHFGYSVGGTYFNYFRIEAPGALLLVIVFGILTAYLMKKRALGFGVLCTLCSFLCNWYGHFVSEGTYPLVAKSLPVSTWYAISGVTIGTIVSIAAIILPIKVFKDKRGHLLCSMILYIGISIISFGFIE